MTKPKKYAHQTYVIIIAGILANAFLYMLELPAYRFGRGTTLYDPVPIGGTSGFVFYHLSLTWNLVVNVMLFLFLFPDRMGLREFVRLSFITIIILPIWWAIIDNIGAILLIGAAFLIFAPGEKLVLVIPVLLIVFTASIVVLIFQSSTILSKDILDLAKHTNRAYAFSFLSLFIGTIAGYIFLYFQVKSWYPPVYE